MTGTWKFKHFHHHFLSKVLLMLGATAQPRPGVVSANGTDSNADTCCLGTNFIILEHTTWQVDVHSCNKQAKPIQNASVVSGATAWDDPISRETCGLDTNEALCHGAEPDHSLLNPNQICHCGIDHQDDPHNETQEISIDPADHCVIIPLHAKCTKIQFES